MEERICSLCGKVEQRTIPKIEVILDPVDPDKPNNPDKPDNPLNPDID